MVWRRGGFYLTPAPSPPPPPLGGGRGPPPRRVYTLVFQEDGIQVSQDLGKTSTLVPWTDVTEVYRRSDITYLYVGDHAYLLPHSQVREGADALWAMLQRRLAPEHLHTL